MGLRNWWRRAADGVFEPSPRGSADDQPPADVDAVAACRDREKVRLRGTIHDLVASTEPRELTAEMGDGSGVVHLVWMGRRSIPGIEAGVTILVEGRISCRDDRRIMYNPRYELGAQL